MGNRTGITRASGTYTTYTYSSRNWLTGMSNKESDDSISQLTGQTRKNSEHTVQWQYTYAYDNVGNRDTETDKDANITTYTYNSTNQLTGTNADGTLTTYAYDSNGDVTRTRIGDWLAGVKCLQMCQILYPLIGRHSRPGPFLEGLPG